MFNTKIQKMVALLAVVAMTGSCLAGCGGSSSSTESSTGTTTEATTEASTEAATSEEGYTGTLVIAIHDQLNNQTIVDGLAYLQEQDKWANVEFDIRDQDADYETNLPIEVMSGSQVDIVYTFNPIYMNQWTDEGIIIPIDDALAELGEDFDARYGAYADAARVDGEVMGIPAGLTSWGLFYNMSIFDEAGIEYPDQYEAMTWTEYRELAAQLTSGSGADKVYGTLNLDWSMYWYQEAIYNLGGGEEFYTADGLSNIEDPAFADALEDTYTMQNIDKSTPTYSEITTSQIEPDGWFTGDYAMYLHGNWILNWLADTDTYPRDYEVGFAPMPVPDDSEDGTLMTSGIVATFSVAATTADATMATDFIIDLNEYATQYSSSEIYLDQTVESEALFVDICDQIEDSMFTTEAVTELFMSEDITFVSEKITGASCAEYEAIVMEEVEMYLADAQDLDTTISNIKTRADDLLSE